MRRYSLLAVLAIVTLWVLASTSDAHAAPPMISKFAASSYDLINAVNNLRTAYGLAPYRISPILMATAQNQADYMAATGSVSHTGPGGSSLTDRLLAAGYPLAGQLSLGGFRSENITSGSESMSAQAAVDQWAGDSLHLTTMISADLTEIGGGVSVNAGRAYFVVDCARATESGAPAAEGTLVADGSTVPATPLGIIIPVVVSTPNADGDIIHEVKAGQTLWQIAISYNTKIDEIKRLNNLLDNDIYPGMRLLIKQSVEIATTATENSPAILPTSTPAVIAPSSTSVSLRVSSPAPSKNIIGSVMGILVLAILGGAIFARLGSTKK